MALDWRRRASGLLNGYVNSLLRGSACGQFVLDEALEGRCRYRAVYEDSVHEEGRCAADSRIGAFLEIPIDDGFVLTALQAGFELLVI